MPGVCDCDRGPRTVDYTDVPWMCCVLKRSVWDVCDRDQRGVFVMGKIKTRVSEPRKLTPWTEVVRKLAVGSPTLTSQKPQPQPKLVRAARRSRHKFNHKRKRSKSLASHSDSKSAKRGELYTTEIRTSISHLMSSLYELGVSCNKVVSLNGSTARCLAAAMHRDMQEDDSLDTAAVCSSYGCTMRDFAPIADRLSDIGGTVALLAHYALHSGGEQCSCALALSIDHL
jgi:hypothetical protein